ncbi:MAG: TetR/AcrR family transcriptional regulator [Caldilineales bacterium]|nr:TetR/AcrR family transcriptional regulator [Caldilineales bacterium]
MITVNATTRYKAAPNQTKPTLSKRERNKRDKRQRLLTQSLRLFREKGYEQTTVSEITRAAGVAKGTFFNYFPTKEDVLLALGEQTLGKLEQADSNQWLGHVTTRGKVKGLFRALALGLDADRELVREMVYRALRLPDLVDRKRARLDFRSTLILVLENGQRRNEIRPNIDNQLIADALYTLYFQQVVVWCTNDFASSLDARLDAVVDLIFDGIVVRE